MTTKKVTISAALKCDALAPAVLRQLGGGRAAIERAIDAANHGADGGFHGFIYYSETTAFTKRNRKLIAGILAFMADDQGTDVIKLVQSFSCFQRGELPVALTIAAVLTGGETEDKDAFEYVANALAWFALEEVGRALIDLSDRE